MHYYRAKRHDGDPLGAEPLNDPGSRKPSQPRLCSVLDCGKPHYAHGYCTKHHQRWKAYGDAEEPLRRGANGTGWRGINNNGYVVIKLLGTVVLEHRQVMEEVLGRKLYPFENVHHKNGIKTDNNPGNLEVRVKVQPSGQRLEDLLTFVAFMAEKYPVEVKEVLAGT
jgi:hypothetical protein